MGFAHGNAEKLKFCFLKIGKSNYERLVLLTIVTKTAESNMPAVSGANFCWKCLRDPKSKLLRFGVVDWRQRQGLVVRLRNRAQYF